MTTLLTTHNSLHTTGVTLYLLLLTPACYNRQVTLLDMNPSATRAAAAAPAAAEGQTSPRAAKSSVVRGLG
jgi:hypothetical protein